MKTQKQYRVLNAGDVRQKGDEVKHNGGGTSPWDSDINYAKSQKDWHPCSLLTHPILPIDLHVASFRRPI